MHLRKGVMIYQPIFSKSNDQSCLRGKSLLTKYLPESIFNRFSFYTNQNIVRLTIK